MLKPAFTPGLEEFRGLESQIQFFASFKLVSNALNYGCLKWEIEGLGEAYGFLHKLKSNKKPFIVRTMVNVQNISPDDSIEWLIDAENAEIATQVFQGLELDGVEIAWKKG
jgi:hypothetical protein